MFQSIELFNQTIKLYGFLNNISFLLAFICLFFLCKDYKSASTLSFVAERNVNKIFKKHPIPISVFLIIEMAVINTLLIQIDSMASSYISHIFLGTFDDNFFPAILVGPIAISIISALLLSSTLKTLDISSFVVNVCLIVFKIACFCEGCCYGVALATGLYNEHTNRYELPIQLIEAGCAVLILILLVIIRKHKKHDGVMYPAFMILYSGTRFCSEFWRDDYTPVIGKLTGYHILCIIGFVLGAIYLAIVLKFGNKITALQDKVNTTVIAKVNDLLHSKPQKKHKS